jgi:hypothetical protein
MILRNSLSGGRTKAALRGKIGSYPAAGFLVGLGASGALKPPVEMPGQPELDSAVDARIAVGCQPGCEQVDVPA